MSNQDKLKEIVRKLIKKEVEEASTSAATPGYQTPYAFSAPKKDKKKKKKRDLGSTGYSYVKEDLAPYKDFGIIQTWEFAHPNNQRVTGPLDRFINMIKTDSYSMLINHKGHEVKEVYESTEVATFDVMVLD